MYFVLTIKKKKHSGQQRTDFGFAYTETKGNNIFEPTFITPKESKKDSMGAIPDLTQNFANK